MRLVGVVVTGGELHVVLGDLGWLTGSSSGTPQVHTTQLISSLIEAVSNTYSNENKIFVNINSIWYLLSHKNI
jgi:hypothetical protein